MRERYKDAVIVCGPSRTKQSFKKQVDINEIVANLKRTGLLSHVNTRAPMYADVSTIPDYQSALNIINVAKASFAALPSGVRERFQNDPGQMISFLADPKNVEEGIALGLLEKKPVPSSAQASPGAGGVTPPPNSKAT